MEARSERIAWLLAQIDFRQFSNVTFIGLGSYLSEPQARSAENSLSSSMDAEI
jgi:hypothetical protein